ncbi:unnamed protein product [Microthlaspi erraticum]|uniref:Uncharacterized protein n=1 Tax=Microthlaspi erraticum TaxID=1685480 RepID=A0A6D2HM25_9BRAS|nr:unnamed protein product [Microthlaspi erraticum]
MNEAWIKAADFNELVNSSEKIGGAIKKEESCQEFRQMLEACGMWELEHKSYQFFCEDWSRRLKPCSSAQDRAHRPIGELSSHNQPAQNTTSVLPSARLSAHTKPGSIAPRSTCLLTTISVLRTIAPSDQEGIVPSPARTLNQIYPPARTRRPNEKSLGHDRSDRTDG